MLMASLNDPMVQALVRGRHIACLASENADGSVHLTATWFLFEDERLYMETASTSRQARNLGARPTASVMIDVRQAGAEYGVTAAGRAELVSGERSHELNQRIFRRYLSPAAMADPRFGVVLADPAAITIELIPTTWTAWDMRELAKALFGGAPAPSGYFLPLDR
jgi:nitroimidazol reductase NimA-like FMN-containing flavoprotein (pyridoxamine 5'-phosphate oxidase superfamily)